MHQKNKQTEQEMKLKQEEQARQKALKDERKEQSRLTNEKNREARLEKERAKALQELLNEDTTTFKSTKKPATPPKRKK
jgi:hypothetical protein